VHRPNRLTLTITLLFVLAGLVVGGIAVSRLLASPGSDVAWVSVVLAVGMVLWGLNLATLGDDDPEQDDDAPGTVSTRTELLTSAIVAALGYVLLRSISDVPPLLCLLAVVVVVGLGMTERILRWRRRRKRPSEG
jgi:hypothetical protein